MAVTPMTQVPPGADGSTGADDSGDGARSAAETTTLHGIISFTLAGRRIELLPPEQIGYLVGVTLLAALDIIEWPVAVVLALGHTLAFRAQRAGLRRFGTILERA